MDQDQIKSTIGKERVEEVLEDLRLFFDNRYTGKVEINFSEGVIAAINVSVYKKGNKKH